MGVGPFWGMYDPYYYSPYYYYPPYAYPYAAPPPDYSGYAPAAPSVTYSPAAQPAPEVASYDLRTFEEQIAKARDSVNYEFSDGDISKEQLQEAGRNIDAVEKEARAEAAVTGGYLTRAQQDALLRALWTGQPPSAPPATSKASRLPASPPQTPDTIQPPLAPPLTMEGNQSAGEVPSGENLRVVTDTLAHLRKLLSGKLNHGDVTKAQYDGEFKYLARIERDARAQASSSGNDLTPVQENTVLMQLLRAQESIQNNFISN